MKLRKWILYQLDEMLECIKYARTDYVSSQLTPIGPPVEKQFTSVHSTIRAEKALCRIEAIIKAIKSLLTPEKIFTKGQ